MAGNEIGDLKFKVDADTAPAQSRIEALKAQAADKAATEAPFTLGKSDEEIDAWIQSLKDAKSETEGMAGAAEKGFGDAGLGGRLKAAKKLYGEQIEVVQGLMGKFFAVGAVATTFYNIGKVIGEQIVDKLETASEKAANFLMTVDKSDAKNAIKKISDQVQSLNEDIADTDSVFQNVARSTAGKVISGGLLAFFAKDRQKIIDERAKLAEGLKGLSNRIAQEKAQADAKVQDEKTDKQSAEDKRLADEKVKNEQQAANQVASLQKKAAYDVMTEEQKIDADAQSARDDLIEAHNKMSKESRIANAEAISQALIDIETKQNAALQKLADERNKQIEETNKKMQESAKRVADSYVSAFRSIREASNSVFNTDQAASMVQFAQQMQITATTAHANMNRIVVEGVG